MPPLVGALPTDNPFSRGGQVGNFCFMILGKHTASDTFTCLLGKRSGDPEAKEVWTGP